MVFVHQKCLLSSRYYAGNSEEVMSSQTNIITSFLVSASLTPKSNSEFQQNKTISLYPSIYLLPPPPTPLSHENCIFLGSKNAQDALQTQVPALCPCMFLSLTFYFLHLLVDVFHLEPGQICKEAVVPTILSPVSLFSTITDPGRVWVRILSITLEQM